MADFYTVSDVEMKECHYDDDYGIEVARNEEIEMSFCDEADVSTDVLMEYVCEFNENHVDADMEGEDAIENGPSDMETDHNADGLLDMSVQEYNDVCYGNKPSSAEHVYMPW